MNQFRSAEFSERVKALREFTDALPAELQDLYSTSINLMIGSVDNYDLEASKANSDWLDVKAAVEAALAP